MRLPRFLLNILIFQYIRCHNSESTEWNGIDESPFYDTIIFSDIADVLNEFENHVNSPIDAIINSESESGEDIEALLTEYQHYLEKAQKQRKSYGDKSKPKNKVPLIRHEKHAKMKPGMSANYNKKYFKGDYYNKQYFKFPEAQYTNPIDLFIPLNSRSKFLGKPEISTTLPKDNHDNKIEKNTYNEKKISDMPQIVYKSTYEPNKSSCFCKNNRMPCDCKCKQCMISLDSFPGQYTEYTKMYDDKKPLRNLFLSDTLFKNPEYVSENQMADNTLNLRIKVDVSLPKSPYGFERYYKNFNRGYPLDDNNENSKQYLTAFNLPFPYFNYPIPIDVFGYNKVKKFSKHDPMPLHKVIMQKKKKPRVITNGKKHRKEVITLHNIKLEPQWFPSHFDDFYNISENDNKFIKQSVPNVTEKLEVPFNTDMPYFSHNSKENQTEETIYLMFNITDHTDNKTEEHKNENSNEIGYSKKGILNITTEMPINKRVKRAISFAPNTVLIPSNKDAMSNVSVLPISVKTTNGKKEKNNITNTDKSSFTDAELLYWPSNNNKSGQFKNITAIILDKENKKAKLNVSKETLRQNHTQALQQAIFGDANWNDVDTIAPTFMSFVGKYITGALTFCSASVCHSMKCTEKTCVHRICSPQERINNKGHCAGSNTTDSVVSMESIMDLPSNIAFEIVDILQEKMLGKLYGKVTLCITLKCISFAASKKYFTKSKCSTKDLNTTGHCPIVKNKKIV